MTPRLRRPLVALVASLALLAAPSLPAVATDGPAPGTDVRRAVRAPADADLRRLPAPASAGPVLAAEAPATAAQAPGTGPEALAAPVTVTLTATPVRGGVRLTTSAVNPAYRVLRAEGAGPEVEVAADATMPWSDTAVTLGTTYTYRVVPVADGAEAPASNRAASGPLPVPTGAEGTFVPVDPERVVDTRVGTGVRRGPVGARESIRFDPAARGTIPPSGVSAVLLNVTGTGPTVATYVTAWPSGTRRPVTSSLNLRAGQTRPNQVVVPLGADGAVELYNNAGSTHLIVDVQGFYSTADGLRGGEYHPVRPQRVADTRRTPPALGPGEEVWVPVAADGVDTERVVAVEVNLTVTAPTAAGHLTAWPGDLDAPQVSNVNFARGQTVANHAVVPVTVDEEGEPGIALRNSAGRTHVIIDVMGWYDEGLTEDGLRFAATRPDRVADTRRSAGRLGPGQSLVVPRRAVPPAAAHVVNVTATAGAGGGHLTVWSGQGSRPATSTVNFGRAEDAPNLATVVPDARGRFAVTAGTSPVHVVVDHLGFFY